MSIEPGVLYVVATPIGNLADIGQRALEVLAGVDLVAAEDTRHSARLLRHYGISTPMISLHSHNERETGARLLQRLGQGLSVALISDAGTPSISDPGTHLVGMARDRGVRVLPVPGPSALTCALSASGLPSDRFVFEGFLPARPVARRQRLQTLAAEERTMVFFEAPHRIQETAQDMVAAFGDERYAVMARELTKMFEEIEGGSLPDLLSWLGSKPEREKGEFVIVVRGAATPDPGTVGPEDERVLRVLLDDLPVARAAALAARLTGKKRRLLYERALRIMGG